MKAKTKSNTRASTHLLQHDIFRSYLLLIIVMAVLMVAAGSLMNISAESRKRDQNLQNIAESIAHSQLLTQAEVSGGETLSGYLDSLMGSLSNVDVISVISADNIRLYHSTHALIGSVYDGTLPDFQSIDGGYYAENSVGPSGSQRRAYAAVYGEDGGYRGFVLAVMLMTNIRAETLRTLRLYGLVAVCVILLSLLLSTRLSRKIKSGLMGYEPDDFSAMYKIRDNILGALDEGIVAVDRSGHVQFANRAASELLGYKGADLTGYPLEKLHCKDILTPVLEHGEKIQNVQGGEATEANILFDSNPIRDGSEIVGAVGILHDRTEYTKLMEDLAGTRYLVDSMRANNHDFTNKLHVILGLIQMEMYDQAKSYIENISIVQRETISQIMHNVDEPSVAALLVGKIARASEVNVKFVLRESFCYSAADLRLPAGALVTILGNLIDNALDAMNMMDGGYETQHTLLFGIFSRPGSLLITVEDNGPGISEAMRERIFENGFSTKGEGRGTGLYHTKKLIEGLGGTISLESDVGRGAVFTVSFEKKE